METQQFETRFNDIYQIYEQDHSSLLDLNMEILSYFKIFQLIQHYTTK